MKRFTNHPEPWGEFLDVKEWKELRNPEKYRGKEIFLSSVTDPYQPAEEKYKRTRRLLEELKGSGCRLSIATKSDLILRDLDLIRSFPNARVAWSINTLDDEFQRQMDKAVSIERRLEAMRIFHEAGISTTCFITPIFPGITDPIRIIQSARERCDLVWLENLNLRGAYKHDILRFIDRHYPDLNGLYHQRYTHKDMSWWHALDERIGSFAKSENFEYVRNQEPDLTIKRDAPVIVNYFFHEQVIPKKSCQCAARAGGSRLIKSFNNLRTSQKIRFSRRTPLRNIRDKNSMRRSPFHRPVLFEPIEQFRL